MTAIGEIRTDNVELEEFGFYSQLFQGAVAAIKTAEDERDDAVLQMAELLAEHVGDRWALRGGAIIAVRFCDVDGHVTSERPIKSSYDNELNNFTVVPGYYTVKEVMQNPDEPATVWLQFPTNIKLQYQTLIQELAPATEAELAEIHGY